MMNPPPNPVVEITQRDKLALQIIMVFGFISGMLWLLFIDWRIALAVLFTHWGNNARLALEKLQ